MLKALSEEEKKIEIEAFRHAVADTKRAVTMRLSESTIAGLKAKADSAGIPYQTLASMILKKFVGGLLLERDAVREVVNALRVS
jgi:predicted DNA binding CopG/RHH family protein